MARKLDLDENGAQYLPFANDLLLKLKQQLNAFGQNFGRVYRATPDGLGTVFCRTLRADALRSNNLYVNDDPNGWWDYIRIRAEALRGYLYQPYLRVVSTDTILLADSPPLWRLPLKGGSFHKFTDYAVDQASNTPQVDGKHTNTGIGLEIFRDGKKTKLTSTSPSLGKWQHKYLIGLAPAQRTLKLAQIGSGSTLNYVVADDQDGALAEGGVNRFTGTNGLFMTYEPSPDGRRVVVDYGAVDKRYLLDIDYARDPPKIITSKFTDASPWGVWTQVNTFDGNLDGSPTSQVWSGTATYPTTYGPTDTGSQKVQIEWGYPASLGNTMTRSYGVSVVSTLWNYTRCVSLRLPNGAKVDIPDSQIKSSTTVTSTDVTYVQETTNVGNIELLYVDPSIPAVLYKTSYTQTVGLPDTYVVTPGEPFASMAGFIQRQDKRDIRLFIGDAERVLHSRILSTTTAAISVDASLATEINIGGFPAPVETVTVTTFPADYLKQLREVTVPGPFDSQDRYAVDIRDAANWVIGYTLLDVSPPQFYLYAGTIDEAKLRTNFVALLVKLLTAAQTMPPDPVIVAAIANLQAGNFDPYDIRLNGVRPISPVEPNPYEPRIGVASLV
jgi:hypothetical protein